MFAVKTLQGSAKERKGRKRKDFFSLFLVVSGIFKGSRQDRGKWSILS